MQLQYQNILDRRSTGTPGATVNIKVAVTVMDESLNLDNRICYKSRREELNRRVKSVLEQKKQIVKKH